MKRCAACGHHVATPIPPDKTYSLYLMYQVVDIYEDKEDNTKEIRTQKIKYICESCRTSSELWKADEGEATPWKVI